MTTPRPPGVIAPRLLIGLIVLVCAEVFSGASLGMGLWHPWTFVVTYWLYFAHFFFFTTLAVVTGRTSLGSLYLWGILFGLYEAWITKVIWYGYSGDGKFALGGIGPFGLSELSMVFIFHPVASFILPLAVACVIVPPLWRLFPGLAWLTGPQRWARLARAYLIVSFAPTMGMNSGGPINLALNTAFALLVALILYRLARSSLAMPDGHRIVVFGRRGFVGLCVYLALLYGFTYGKLRPAGLPSTRVQLFTLLFYAFAILGLSLHRRRLPADFEPDGLERGRVVRLLVLVFGLGFLCSIAGPPVFVIVVLNFAIWLVLGVALTGAAFLEGLWEYLGDGPRRRGRVSPAEVA